MGKNIIFKCLSLVLASALVLTGCGHDSRKDVDFPGDIVGSGGGPVAAAAAAAAAAAVVGPGGAFPNNNFSLNPTTETQVAGRNNPTQVITAGNRVYYVGGLALGQNNGQLFVAEIPSPFSPNTVPTFIPVTAPAGSAVPGTFNNPFGLVALDPTLASSDLFVSTGFNVNGDGQLIRISGVTIANGAATGTFSRVGNNVATGAIVNPAFLMIASDINGAGNRHLFWSEYVGAGAPGGRVRRIRVDANAPANSAAEDIIQGLSFPAGIATNGADLYVCDSAGGGNGQVLRTPLNWAGQTLGPASPEILIVAPIVAETANGITRPFDITYDGVNGMFFSEGAVISLNGFAGPAATGPGAGRVRFLPTNSSEASVVATGLTNAAGISATPLTAAGTTVGVIFTESVQINGRVLRTSVDTTTIGTANAPAILLDQIAIGWNSPLDVAIVNIFQPVFVSTENYFGGVANGLVNFYNSTGS